jgi:hypothetical protein
MLQYIQIFFNTCLRRIFNIKQPDKIRNEDLWEREMQEPVAEQILRRKWARLDTSSGNQHHTPNPDLKPTEEEERDRLHNSRKRDTEAEMREQGID